MANTQAISNEFKKEAMAGMLDSKTQIKAALYYASATINASTDNYQTTGEVAGTGYSAGGVGVTNGNTVATGSDTAYWTPSAAITYTSVTISTAFDCVLLYDDATTSPVANVAIGAFTFGSTTVGGGNFTLTMPTNNATSALVRIG